MVGRDRGRVYRSFGPKSDRGFQTMGFGFRLRARIYLTSIVSGLGSLDLSLSLCRG